MGVHLRVPGDLLGGGQRVRPDLVGLVVGPRDVFLGRALGQGQNLQRLVLAGLTGLSWCGPGLLTAVLRLGLLAGLRRDEGVFRGLAVR
ncbi:hypothetical protein Abr02nite_45760 [Paractinoplanes brasiliensis]|nr:hypothetical protein Abr02nite_45760 [Actinoplanes brasiliensis]